MLIFTSQLAQSLGPLGTIGLFVNYGFTAWILKKATPAFGRMAAVEARLEGEYRAALGRVGRDGEEVACVLALESLASTDRCMVAFITVARGKRQSFGTPT
jgi:ABC-type uncharacterized transport system fused permease/ATPase subunit